MRYFQKNVCINYLKNNHKNSFHSITILKFEETKVKKEKNHAIKVWEVNAHNIDISKLVKTKTNSDYSIGYLDKAIRELVLIMPRMSGYAKTFKVKDEDKDKKNKLMSFSIDHEKLLENY